MLREKKTRNKQKYFLCVGFNGLFLYAKELTFNTHEKKIDTEVIQSSNN